ncbi:MAG: Ig-like domain-containing protein [Gemmatimonadaceae bacterium]
MSGAYTRPRAAGSLPFPTPPMVRVGALLVTAALFVTACSDSTNPSPVATSITTVRGASQSAVVGTALANPVVVQVNDQNGAVMAGVTVTFAALNGSTVDASTATTDANGQAHVSWTLGTVAGADSLTVTAGTVAPVYEVATGTPDAPMSLVPVSGSDQSADAGNPLANPIVLRVVDRYGNAVAGVTVTWSSSSGALGAASSVSDASGLAQTTLTLGGDSGEDDVIATLTTASGPVTLTFTETAM